MPWGATAGEVVTTFRFLADAAVLAGVAVSGADIEWYRTVDSSEP